MSAVRDFATSARARWVALAPRERLGVVLAAAVLGLGLVWGVLLAPAMRTVQAAATQQLALDQQLRQMQAMAAQARSLQAQPEKPASERLRALEQAVLNGLGKAGQLNVVGDRATVTLKGVSGEALSQWLAQVRANARAVPVEARLTRATDAATGAAAGAAQWNGTLVLRLP